MSASFQMGKEFPLYQKDRDLCFSDLEIIGDDIDQTQERGRRKLQGERGEEMAPLGHRKARDLPHPAQGQPLESCKTVSKFVNGKRKEF